MATLGNPKAAYRETFFIYDTNVVRKEEDDPFDAIIYFHPESTDAVDQVAIVGHLIGMFTFFKSFAGYEPRFCKLQNEKYVTKQHNQYIFALSTGLAVPNTTAEKQLDLLYTVFTAYHCTMHDYIQDDSSAEQYRIWQCILPFILRNDDMVGKAFHSIPTVDLPKTAPDIFLQSSNTLQAIQQMPGVLAGIIMFKSNVLCTQMTPELTRLFLIVQSYQEEYPFEEVALAMPLPSGVKIINIFLSPQYTTELLQTKSVKHMIDHEKSAIEKESDVEMEEETELERIFTENVNATWSDTDEEICSINEHIDTSRNASNHTHQVEKQISPDLYRGEEINIKFLKNNVILHGETNKIDEERFFSEISRNLVISPKSEMQRDVSMVTCANTNVQHKLGGSFGLKDSSLIGINNFNKNCSEILSEECQLHTLKREKKISQEGEINKIDTQEYQISHTVKFDTIENKIALKDESKNFGLDSDCSDKFIQGLEKNEVRSGWKNEINVGKFSDNSNSGIIDNQEVNNRLDEIHMSMKSNSPKGTNNLPSNYEATRLNLNVFLQDECITKYPEINSLGQGKQTNRDSNINSCAKRDVEVKFSEVVNIDALSSKIDVSDGDNSSHVFTLSSEYNTPTSTPVTSFFEDSYLLRNNPQQKISSDSCNECNETLGAFPDNPKKNGSSTETNCKCHIELNESKVSMETHHRHHEKECNETEGSKYNKTNENNLDEEEIECNSEIENEGPIEMNKQPVKATRKRKTARNKPSSTHMQMDKISHNGQVVDSNMTKDHFTEAKGKLRDQLNMVTEDNVDIICASLESLCGCQEDEDDLQRYTLYSQSHSQTLLLLVMDFNAREQPSDFHTLSKIAFPQLAELDFKVAECMESVQNKDHLNQKHSLQFDPFMKTLTWLSSSLSKDFVKMASDSHNRFEQDAELKEITSRNHAMGIHAENSLGMETFLHMPSSTINMLSSPFHKRTKQNQINTETIFKN